jgi:hypothetical protein
VIADDAIALVELADRRKTLQQLVAEAKKFATRRQQLAALLGRLRTAVQTEALFREQNVGHPAVPTTAGTVGKVVADGLAGFDANPQAALEGLGELEKRVAAFVEKFDKAIKETWTEYARAKVRSDNEDVLAVLEKIPDFKPTVKKVRTLRAQLQAQTSSLPITAVALAEFHATIAAIAAEWNTLGSDAVPQTVIDFLRKAVSPEGARLDILLEDPSIATWLTEKKVMPAFRIRLA